MTRFAIYASYYRTLARAAAEQGNANAASRYAAQARSFEHKAQSA